MSLIKKNLYNGGADLKKKKKDLKFFVYNNEQNHMDLSLFTGIVIIVFEQVSYSIFIEIYYFLSLIKYSRLIFF